MNFLSFLEAQDKTDIWFQKLGIHLKNVGSGISVFGYRIAFYGIVIAAGMIIGYMMAEWTAKRTKQNPENYLDFAIIAVIVSVLCARLYYVIFNWKEYKGDWLKILDIREGGLAIYGGVIGGIVTAILFAKKRKLNKLLFMDTAIIGLITGQIIGRWGNFFNREAFGCYSNGLFSMQVDVREVSPYFNSALNNLDHVKDVYANQPRALERILEIRNNPVVIDGAKYISVQPTFLYESLWNLVLLIIMLVYTKHKKFDGEILLLYLFGYGLGRLWIEGLRSDQLFLFNSPIAVSQLLSGLLVIFSVVMYVILYRRHQKKTHPVAS